MVSFVLASVLASAQPAPKTPVQICVETCVEMAQQPGYELRQCIAQCNAHNKNNLFSTPIEVPDEDQGFCETYEEPCDRPVQPDLF